MNQLDEIFKTNPKLLDEPEVKELIAHCEQRFKFLKLRLKHLNKFYDFVIEKCMYSSVFLKNGIDCDDTIKSILDYIEKD
jgi:hypothetical protein